MKQWLAINVQKWLAGSLAMVLGLGLLSGCQPTFLVKENYDSAHITLPSFKIDENCAPTAPLTTITQAPPTVNQPERPPRYMTLQEAIALSLENGRVSARAGQGTGINDTTQLTFQPGAGTLNGQSDNIRVLALNPAIAHSVMEASLARFDAVWVTGMSLTNTDALTGIPNLPGNLGSVAGQSSNFQSSIVKAFANGGVANVSFLVDYRNLSNVGGGNPLAFAPLNPQYSTRVAFGYEMPLWRDAGVEINQLLARFPSITGSSLAASTAGTGFNARQSALSALAGLPIEGTLISRLRSDQTRAEFERNVQILVLNTEVAYWNLYNKYGQLYSFEENLRILQKAYQESYFQWKAGRLGNDKYYQFRGQFEEFRGERFRALEEVLDAERNLRGIIGLPVEDGTRVVPITPPTLAELRPTWENCLHDALNLRPELVLARENLKYHQFLLSIQKNSLKPDLRAYVRYEPFGDGSSLVGSGGTFADSTGTTHSSDAFRSLAGGHLADSQIGVYMNVPIGFRFEYAGIRSARLQLAQSYYVVRDMEDRATSYLANQFQDVAHQYKRIGAHRSERLAYLESLKSLDQQVKVGKINYSDQQNGLQYLSIQRSYASALVKEFNAIAEYNNAVARLEWAKGTVLAWNNVHISEGPLPQAAQVRAVEYEKERSRSLVLRDRPDSLAQPGRMCTTKESDLPTIEMPIGGSETWQGPSPSQVLPPADLPGAEKKQPAALPQIETLPAPAQKQTEKRPPLIQMDRLPASDLLPMPRTGDPSRPLSLQSTPGLKQANFTAIAKADNFETPTFRSIDESKTPAMPAPLSPTINVGQVLPAPFDFLTPTPRP